MGAAIDAYPLDHPAARARWQHLLDATPPSPTAPYATLAFLDGAAACFDCNGSLHLVGSDEIPDAAAALLWTRTGPYRVVPRLPFVAHTALAFPSAAKEAAVHRRDSPLGALARHLAQTYTVARLSLADISDVRPLQWDGWSVMPRYTYRCALDTPGDPLGDWSSSARRSFRTACDDYDVAEAPEAIGPVVDLCAASYERHGRSLPADALRLTAWMQKLQDAGSLRVFVARRDGHIEAGCGLLHDATTAHYWIAGSVPGPAMTVLLGALLPVLRADGVKTFDFVGANTASIAEFKRRLGGQLTSYWQAEHVARPEVRLYLALRGQ